MRFLVFWGDDYYPRGGWQDEHRAFASLPEAIAFAQGNLGLPGGWAHVVDLGTGTLSEGVIVWRSEG